MSKYPLSPAREIAHAACLPNALRGAARFAVDAPASRFALYRFHDGCRQDRREESLDTAHENILTLKGHEGFFAIAFVNACVLCAILSAVQSELLRRILATLANGLPSIAATGRR